MELVLLHIAPNHGQEDFDLGQMHNLGNDPSVNEKGVMKKILNFLRVCMYFKSDEKVIDELNKSKNLFLIQFTAIVILIHGDQKLL